MTIHETGLQRMQKEGMVATAIETIRRAIADTEEEIAESRMDIADQRARIDEDELYVIYMLQRLAALKARLAQLEGAAPDADAVIPHH